LLFTFAIPYSPYTNDDDNNGSRPPTLNITFEFFNGIHVKKIGINSGWNVGINNTMVVDSIVMTTCMSPFSTFRLLIQCKKIPPSQTCIFANVVHAFLYKAISPSK
jgi:hypothetical protein